MCTSTQPTRTDAGRVILPVPRTVLPQQIAHADADGAAQGHVRVGKRVRQHFVASAHPAEQEGCAQQQHGGQVEEAVILLDEALQIVERTRERWFEAELYRLKGQLLLRQGRFEAAEDLYRKALSVSQEQRGKLWELRAAVSLARLCGDRGKRAQAHELLVPVYGWFTGGFDTPDLKEAKALLHELTRTDPPA
jgi:tetratricopeptide (TPR) repeat protein